MPAPTRQSAESQMDRRRRRHARYRSNFRVAVSHLGNHYQTVEGHCRDLSEAGIGILLAAELENGEVIRLSGQGAGRRPTAVSVMGDLHEIARLVEGGGRASITLYPRSAAPLSTKSISAQAHYKSMT